MDDMDSMGSMDYDCVPVNNVEDNPGYYTCDCVDYNDECLSDGGCVVEMACPGVDGQAMGDSGGCPSECASAISSASADAVCGDDGGPPAPCTESDALTCMAELIAKCSSGGCPSECASAISSASADDVCGDGGPPAP